MLAKGEIKAEPHPASVWAQQDTDTTQSTQPSRCWFTNSHIRDGLSCSQSSSAVTEASHWLTGRPHTMRVSLCHISFIEETQGLRLGPYLGGTLNNLPSIQTLIYLKFWLCLNPSYLQSCPCLSEIGGRGETQQSYSSATLCVLLIGCSPPHQQRPQWTWQPRHKFSLLRCKQRGLWRNTATARHWNVRLEHIAPSRMSCNDIWLFLFVFKSNPILRP